MDYAKAFDKVDHQLLIRNLQLYGFHPKIIIWIESFLTNRTQQVVVDGHMSIIALIISGVPQGTVLGPILFLIFINDIACCVLHSTLRCFADDTRICRSISNSYNVTELQSDLDEVTKWSSRNNMALHDRVAIIGTKFFIAIIDNFFKIIAILSVIGDKFGNII